MNRDRELIKITPSERQYRHQQMEFYAFIHFTVNTFTNREWGDGTESPQIFNPVRLDARQWARAVKSAGMTGLILTCKHHDGFCLWPSRYTEHSVASSPWKRGRGDVVRETAEACREAGLRFGVYLSPWDRHSPLYGTGTPYDDYFVAQLTELLTNYGPIFSVWLDGACGEGDNGKKQYYDWDRYYAAVRALQPEACICVCGPDVRWCGNEAGDTREAEWSVVPRDMRDTEKVASRSQQEDSAAFRTRRLNAQDRDLGSREKLKDEKDLIWYPAEVNTSIRPGWFWHPEEDGRVKPLRELCDIYERSVGGNATFLLNIPPTRDGLLHETDAARLKEMGEYLSTTYRDNVLSGPEAAFDADFWTPGNEADKARTDDDENFWMPKSGQTEAAVTCRWDRPRTIQRVVLMENILMSQRVEAFRVELLSDGEWKQVFEGKTIGYKRIVPVSGVIATGLRVRILDARVCPTLRFIGAYAKAD